MKTLSLKTRSPWRALKREAQKAAFFTRRFTGQTMRRVFHNAGPSEGGNEACRFVPRQVYVSCALPFFLSLSLAQFARI